MHTTPTAMVSLGMGEGFLMFPPVFQKKNVFPRVIFVRENHA